ncbi:DUF418 domain-containing protein [Lutibacter flavus]|uniref:DUF418 domain-containing protein n=1 Tax=Lutibacter flavus TaxID=691689 RepID=A0A238VMP3_9FLAO|nr:DUF418 domain-containing protein [Lutibacter flavus]SNR35488.1 uncharacterized protein SAMN04488111_0725 [Lutibacter flavus]
MEENISLSSPLKRITVLDALRGFALLGVILIHMIQHFGIFSMSSQNEVLHFPMLDEAVRWIGNNIIMGRFINIFAFLFGISFFIQMDRAEKKGVNFRFRFIWRMILLLSLGLLAHSFFNLEIISIYAFFGLLLLPLYRVKNYMLLTLVALLLIGGPRIIQVVNHNNKLAKEQVVVSEESNNDQTARTLPEHTANPSFLNSAKYNYEERLPGKLNYQFGFIGRGYITLALFILGLYVGRNRFFEKIDEQKKRNLWLFVGFLSGTLLITLIQKILPDQNMFILFRPDGQNISTSILLTRTLEDIGMVLFTGALTMGFILLYQKTKFRNYLEVLSPYGRTALTNYIIQGVIGCLIFAPWAFGTIFSDWGVSALFFLGIVIYIVQIIFSKMWLKRFLYGPLEWLWRSGTYLKFQPFIKRVNK